MPVMRSGQTSSKVEGDDRREWNTEEGDRDDDHPGEPTRTTVPNLGRSPSSEVTVGLLLLGSIAPVGVRYAGSVKVRVVRDGE